MTQSEIDELILLLQSGVEGDLVRIGKLVSEKSRFKALATKYLKRLAKALGLTDFKVIFNPGGVAVSGEASLSSDRVYVSLGCTSPELGVLYRKCVRVEGKKPKYESARYGNNWMPFRTLSDFDRVVEILSTMVRT